MVGHNVTHVIKIDLTPHLMNGTLGKTLEALPGETEKWAEEVLMQNAALMVGYAQILVRVDTGALRDSIRREHTAPLKVKVRAGGYKINPKTGKLVNYATHVEAKYPFMRPALEMIKPELIAMLESGYPELLQK